MLFSSSTSHRLLVFNRISSGWQNRQLARLISPWLKPGALRLFLVTIPPMVPHAAINLSDEPCMLINAVQYHGTPTDRDYQPMHPPLAYDWPLVSRLMPAWPVANPA